MTATTPWWQTAVFYQIYPRSFRDGNGDGTGDLIGVADGLDHLGRLGVDAIWLSPFYVSPLIDGGYDVADPTDVDPRFGTLADFDAVVSGAHARDIRVTVDLVPNHFSTAHPWFREALAAAPGSPARERFVFRDGRGPDGSQPPNNWPSLFGGPAWTRVADGQWYLHLFAPEQADLNWDDPAVWAEFERILRFWLDRGVDGFRIDVAHGMAKPAELADMDMTSWKDPYAAHQAGDLRFDNDGVHAIHRMFRRVLDSYPGQRMAVGEAWVPDVDRLSHYVRPDELNLVFNFSLLEADWSASAFRHAITGALDAFAEAGAPCTWVLANHDVVRDVTRYGGGARGTARARAAALVQLSLPGAVYVYNGDELGLPNVELPDWALDDPTWERSGHTERGRDGERVPLPWSGDQPPYGFTSAEAAWLPQPDDWAGLTVEAQAADSSSTLSLYRDALALRQALPALRTGGFDLVDSPDGTLSYRRGADLLVVLNAGSDPAALPAGEVLVASGPVADGLLPADTAAWLRLIT